jgi:hypothetical protein
VPVGAAEDTTISPASRLEIDSGLRRRHVAAADLALVKRLVDERRDSDFVDLYERMLECFQDEYGKIIDFYRYSNRSAVIQTSKDRRWPLPLLSVRPTRSIFPLFSIGGGQVEGGSILTALISLDLLSTQILRGADRIILADEITNGLAQLFEKLAERGDKDLSMKDVDVYRRELDRLEAVTRDAARRGIPLTYLGGMLLGLVPITLVGALAGWLLSRAAIEGFAFHTFLGVTFSGGIGALLSVMTRMASGRFELPLKTARDYVRLLGVLRPFVGAIFGVVVYFALVSELLAVRITGNPGRQFFAFCVLSFVAGFYERWAQDVLVGVGAPLGVSSSEPERPPETEAERTL